MRNSARSDGESSWGRAATILSRYDIDADGTLDYEEFRALCVELFGADEVKENEQRAREVFGLFDMNEDGTLDERELHRCCEWIRETVNPVNVLLVVDVQHDFIDGVLALQKCGYGQDGAEVLEPINRLLTNGRWDKVVYTQDWHPENHISFYENLSLRELHPKSKVTRETAQLFDTVVFLKPHVTQTLWPKHCVKNTWGAELHKDLLIVPSSERVHKGRDSDNEMYSAFGDQETACDDGCKDIKDILSEDIGVIHLYVCGLAYDICVKETCLKGLRLGYRLAVIDDCCRGTNPSKIAIAKKLISANGGLIANSDRVLSLVNEGKRSLAMARHAAISVIERDSVDETTACGSKDCIAKSSA